MLNLTIRLAYDSDIPAILQIYNQGIEDRIATLETDLKDLGYMMNWYDNHQGRYKILLACHNGKTIGWASLNPYSQRCAYQGVADLSIYIDRENIRQDIYICEKAGFSYSKDYRLFQVKRN
ncbi:GNAT family N-acetyltransferase [Paenibacillus thiaminolyticus]|uniref:GNAT family N-acetyltransferase n=1 Tax=Paenibacillus thiaminolyticus TaxID=49283 RepID=A0A3A3GH09_PANTH|nr:GNAT family N-acetyltransferase [Paenibacillus thiaminolyticus]